MKLLAVDTSSIACSLALQVDETLFERHVVEAKIHTRILIPMIRELLAQARMGVDDLDALVLGNGPGSFIGMRIGASVIQGLAFAGGLAVLPVSSLAAVAAEVMQTQQASCVAVAQDARMNEVYLGCFEESDAGVPEPLQDELIHPVGRIDCLHRKQRDWSYAGAAWECYPQLQTANAASSAELSPVQFPRARYLLPIAAAMFDDGRQIQADQLQPAYLRNRVATPAGT